MDLTGASIVVAELQPTSDQKFYAVDPVTGDQLQPAFAEATTELVDRAVAAAEADFDGYRRLPLEIRARFLGSIAKQLRSVENELIERAMQETGLPHARLQGEMTRTVNQLLMFAEQVRDGAFLQPRVTPALPDRQPLPRPDIRMTQLPLGPVAVFGASNFPFAFSVAGGDTASALAAGCPVIVKGHPAHPGTCELAAGCIVRALEEHSIPRGVFSLLQGARHQLGAELVRHPQLAAVAFTGSQTAGRALFDLSVARDEPIPFFAEMGSVNPVFLLPQALSSRGEQLATGYAGSVALGVGQFCTNPGLLFALQGPKLDGFVASIEEQLAASGVGVMLHSGIKSSYLSAFDRLAARPGVSSLRGDIQDDRAANCRVAPALLRASADAFLADESIAEEVFGPAAVVVSCESLEQMSKCAATLRGQLTATILAEPQEEVLCRELFGVLERKAGRLILNGFPTGVEVCPAMVHGGPYPATTDSRSTSVGTMAIDRFLRPVCLQGFSQALLPVELQDLD